MNNVFGSFFPIITKPISLFYPRKILIFNLFNIEVLFVFKFLCRNNISIVYNNETLIIKCTQDANGTDQFSLTDKSGKEVAFALNEDSSSYVINDERFPFSFSSIRSDSFNGYQITIDDKTWYFTNFILMVRVVPL